MRAPLLTLGGTVFEGRFRIDERIAEGGFAVVYGAWQVALERRVALKVLKPHRNHDEAGRAEFSEKFAIEAKTIARLRHPHIVDVHDYSVSTLPSGEIVPWMALEWLDGETLAMHLRRRRQASARGREPGEAVDFLRPVLEALAHAHRSGIVHRDVKPSNIMVTETPQGPSLRVLDFGIAKIMVDTRSPNTGDTRTESAPAFSPAYAAPEQVAFSRTGPWTDVHALGLILTEVMTDEPPFSDPDPEAHLFEQVMARTRPTPASKGHDVGLFEPVLARALALSPRDRWRNAGDLLAALDEAREPGTAALSAKARSGEAPDEQRIVVGVTPRGHLSWAGRAAVLALGASIALSGAIWALRREKESQAPRPPPSLSVRAPDTGRELTPPLPEASSGAPSALTTSSGFPVATVPPTPSPPAGPRRTRKRARPAPIPVSVGDGRDLFDDTQ